MSRNSRLDRLSAAQLGLLALRRLSPGHSRTCQRCPDASFGAETHGFSVSAAQMRLLVLKRTGLELPEPCQCRPDASLGAETHGFSLMGVQIYKDGENKRMGRRSQSGRSAEDTRGKSIAEFEARQDSLEENRQEQQQTNTVELPITEQTRNTDSTSGAETSRKRQTRSCILIDLCNAARDMARAIATNDGEVDIVDITDGWETLIGLKYY